MNFLKTPEAQEIIWLDYWGYPLASRQQDLTPLQAAFILKGRAKLQEEMNKQEKERYSSIL